MADRAGQQVLLAKRYLIGSRLGDGGIGVVYVAFDQAAHRSVAVKTLKPEYTQNSEVLDRFEQEARVTLRLAHPNVATIYDFGRDGGTHFIVLEKLGPALNDLLEAHGRLPVRTAAHIVRQVLAGLGAAHAAGVVHRDVKPQNVLFLESAGGDAIGRASSIGESAVSPTRGLAVKVVDFGIARILNTRSLTAAGKFFGTPLYVSPEQASGKPIGPASDLYSTGVLLYQLLTGQVPFDGASDLEILRKHVENQPPSPREVVPGIPADLDALVMRALAKQPERRWPSAEAMRSALARFDYAADAPAGGADRDLASSRSNGQTRVYPLSFGTVLLPTTSPVGGEPRKPLGRLRNLLHTPAAGRLPKAATVPLDQVVAPPTAPPSAVKQRRGRLGTAGLVLATFVLALVVGLALLNRPTAATPVASDGPLAVLPARAFAGGCLAETLPARLIGATVVLGQASACPRASAQFELAERPRGAVALRISALNSPIEMPEVAVLVNDRQTYRGGFSLPAGGGRGEIDLTVPDGTLKAGRNRLEIRNLSSDAQPEFGPWLMLFSATFDRG